MIDRAPRMTGRSVAPCRGIAGRLYGHDYAPRYTVESRTLPRDLFVQGGTSDVSDYEKSTYHGEVCTRCGRALNVPGSAADVLYRERILIQRAEWLIRVTLKGLAQHPEVWKHPDLWRHSAAEWLAEFDAGTAADLKAPLTGRLSHTHLSHS